MEMTYSVNKAFADISKYDYDNNGNQLSKTAYTIKQATNDKIAVGLSVLGIVSNSASPQHVSLTEINKYNRFNQLVKTETGQTTVTYNYRADGLRLSKITNGQTTTHVWDGSNIVADLNGSRQVISKYIRGVNLIKSIDKNSNSAHYVYNAHGDVVHLAKQDGSVVNYNYDAFGVEINPNPNDANPFRYCGEYLDFETSNIYLRNRFYVPGTGRFSSEDPVKDGLNWYTYCINNPISFFDPLGLMTEEDILAVMSLYEMDMMAPMAYTYAFRLIYNWYLADSDDLKNYIDSLFYSFRDTGYTTTNGIDKTVDEGIIFMPKKPGANMTEAEHYFRNKLNLSFTWEEFQKLSEVLPKFLEWNDKVPANLHQNIRETVDGKVYDNLKFVSADGHFELIFSGYSHTLLTETNNFMDMGTYNYANPATDWWGHYWLDVRPYSGYRNTKEDYYKYYKQYYNYYGYWPS